MKTKLALLILGVLVVFLAGCYTQFESVRNENDNNEYVDDQQEYTDSTVNYDSEQYTDNSCCDDYYHPRVGFSYYYPSNYWPSYTFGVAYNDPWFYDSYWSYNPWNYYYMPYAWSVYNGYYPYSYYYGYWGGYYHDGYGYGYGGQRRTDGSVLLGGRDRIGTRDNSDGSSLPAVNTNMNLPTGARVSGGTSGSTSTSRNSAVVQPNARRTNGSSAVTSGSTTRTNRPSGQQSVRSSGRQRNDSGTRTRSSGSSRGTRSTYTPPRTQQPSYTPPPQPSAQPSSPPPSNDGGRRSESGNNNSGNSGGRRR